jgi:hypothetical protein
MVKYWMANATSRTDRTIIRSIVECFLCFPVTKAYLAIHSVVIITSQVFFAH